MGGQNEEQVIVAEISAATEMTFDLLQKVLKSPFAPILENVNLAGQRIAKRGLYRSATNQMLFYRELRI